MKASYAWIRELVPTLTATPLELAARFTSAGLEIEGVHTYGAGTEACIVVRVLSTRPHPQRSSLKLVTVDRGGATLEIVCGAPNVPAPGGLVVLAPLGAHLPAKNMTIEPRAIGSITSEGMLCSDAELGLSDDGEGILILPDGIAAPGTLLNLAVPSTRDTIYEINVLANRPDALGHIGLAREAAALYGIPWRMPAPAAITMMFDGSIDDVAKVRVEDFERCPHYGATLVEGVTIGPSPLAMRHRLASLGVRPISNVVDVTNLAMFEFGHPMHAFDFDHVARGTIVVRRAKEGEPLATLDGVDRKLSSDDLVICDGEKPVALAGVMGGKTSEISAATKRVLFECAYFDPRGVRRASRRHGIHSESSHRFERGVDPSDVDHVLARAMALTIELAGGDARAREGTIHAVDASEGPQPKIVRLESSRLDSLLGIVVPWQEAIAILTRLGFDCASSDDHAATFRIPTHRPDCSREVDLIEEVARVRGMDAIVARLPAIRPTRETTSRESFVRRVRAAAVELGLSEAVTYGFVDPKELRAISAPEASVVLKNPLSEHHSVMRTSLLPGLIDALATARRHGERDVRAFTIGATFHEPKNAKESALPEERLAFAAIVAGDRTSYLAKPTPVDVWDAKGIAEGLLHRVRRSAKPRVAAFDAASRPAHLHPRGAARVFSGELEVGRIGPLHPDVLHALDLGEGALVVEIALDHLASLVDEVPKFTAIPRFPASTRDIALVVSDDIAAGEVENVVREAAGELAEEVRIFDRFVGGALPPDHASLAFHVVYRAKDRTLTDAEVDAQHAKVVLAASNRFGAKLRS